MTRDETKAAILAAVRSEVALSPDAERLWAVCADHAPSNGRALDVCATLRVHPTSLHTNMARRGLPSPKLILAHMGLCHASTLFDRERTAQRVAYTLGWAELSGWTRHLKSYHGLRASQVRDEVPFPMARERLLDAVVRMYREQWGQFEFFTNAREDAIAARSRMAA